MSELLPCYCHGDDPEPYCPRHTRLPGEAAPDTQGIHYLCHACGSRLEYRDYGKWYWCPRCSALRRKPKHPALIEMSLV